MTATGAAAIVGWGIAMACVIGAIVVRLVAPAPFLPVTFGFGPLAMVAFMLMATSWASVGAFLAVRRPGNAIGAVMVASGAGYALSMFALALTFAFAADGTTRGLELAEIAGWVTVLGTQIGAFAFLIGFIFPTGRGQSGAWQWAVRLGLPGMLLFGAAILLQPGSLHLFPTLTNPFGVGPDLRFGQPVSPIVGLFGVTLSPLVAVSMATRYRAAGRVERLQLKWFSLAVIAAFLGVGASASAVVYVQGSPSETGLVVYGLALAGVPVAIAIAILRHHLYDIDRLISRTLGYGAVSGVLGVVFVGIILVTQWLLAPVTGERSFGVAISTLVVFALFQPVRRRVQSIVDRRFDRARYDADLTVSTFAARLRNDVDLGTVRNEIVGTATTAVRPTTASVWLRGTSR